MNDKQVENKKIGDKKREAHSCQNKIEISICKRSTKEEIINESLGENIYVCDGLKKQSGIILVDTHAHIADDAFNEQQENIVARALQNGVEKIITSGYDLSSSVEAVKMAERFEGVFASVGFYPENCEEFDQQALRKLAENKKVVAIGEIGLQYTENSPAKEKQIAVFEKQIQLAYEMKLPIVIHCRDAYGECLEVLKKNREYLQYGGTLHCYSGSAEMMKEFVKLGLHISVGGVSTFKNAEKIKKVAAECPLANILLETDCPYLTPHPYRGRRNEPMFVLTIAQNLAELKSITLEEVAKVTTENARRLFKI